MNIEKILRTFFTEYLWWLLLGTAINQIYSKKYLFQNSKDNMLPNSISVDIKVYATHLKQISTADVFHGILQNSRTVTFKNNLRRLLLKYIYIYIYFFFFWGGVYFLKVNTGKSAHSDNSCGFRFFHFFQGVIHNA